MKGIIILDTSYTLSMCRDRQLTQALVSRSLSGYFSTVLSVHPLAGLFDSPDGLYGRPKATWIEECHLFVEGRLGLSSVFRAIPPVNFLLAQFELLRFILRFARCHKIDVIRIGDPYYLGLLGLVLSRILSIPLAIRVGSRYDDIVKATGAPFLPRLFRYRWIEKLIEKEVLKRCDLVAGANQDNLDYAVENGARKEVGTVFRYGNLIHSSHWIDPSKRPSADRILEEIGINSSRFLITIARLEKDKYVADSLYCVAELMRRGQIVRLILVGNGRELKYLKSLASELGIIDLVIFAGYQDQDWLSAVLPRASVIISPQMGRALTEATLAAVPVVAYDYDWQKEIVVNGQTGFLVPHKNWRLMAEKIDYLLTHEKVARAMGLLGRENTVKMMNPQTLECHEKDQYESLFARMAST